MDVDSTSVGNTIWSGLASIFKTIQSVGDIGIARFCQVSIHSTFDVQVSRVTRIRTNVPFSDFESCWKQRTADTTTSAVMDHNGTASNVLTLSNGGLDRTTRKASMLGNI